MTTYVPLVRMRPSLYKNPIPTVKASTPSASAQTQTPLNPFDLAAIINMVNKFEDRVNEVLAHVGSVEDLKKMHDEVKQHVADIEKSLGNIKQGAPGTPARQVDLQEVARLASQLVPTPKNGNTPIVDHKKIARMAAKFIEVPKVEHGKDADPATVAQLLAEKFENGEIKVSHKNIEGLDDKFAEVRSKVATEVEQYGKNTWKRGGGDIVVAGTGVTITTNGSGQKIINVSGGGTPKIADLSAQCDGSNKIFTIPEFTTILVLNGTDAPIIYRNSIDFTATGTTLTLGAGVNAPSQGATLLLTYA